MLKKKKVFTKWLNLKKCRFVVNLVAATNMKYIHTTAFVENEMLYNKVLTHFHREKKR